MKQDVRGRMRMPLAQREALLDEFERSGLAGPKFAALAGVKYPTFAGWVHERRKKRGVGAQAGGDGLPPVASFRLVEAVGACGAKNEAESIPASSVLQVHLFGGVRLEVGDLAQVKLAAALLKALGMERSC